LLSKKAAGAVSSQLSAVSVKIKVKGQGEGQTLANVFELVSKLLCCALLKTKVQDQAD